MTNTNPPIEITAVWLRQESLDTAVVLAEVGGQWVELVREKEGGPYSYIVNANGIRSRVDGEQGVSP